MALTVSKRTVRRLAIYLQGLTAPDLSTAPDGLLPIVQRIGLLQLDSVNAVDRSHYLVMHSRAGACDRAALDALLADGHLFEYWAHAACLIPIEHYPWFTPKMQSTQREQYYRRLPEKEFKTVVTHVRQRIQEEGVLASKDFKHNREQAGTWWNWKPAKACLEYLFDRGELMVSHRKNFQRYYDLKERVLPPHLDTQQTREAYEEWAIIKGLRHTGVGTLDDIRDYYRLRPAPARRVMEAAVQAGTVQQVTIEGLDAPAFIHQEDVPLLQAIQDGEHTPRHTTLLSPFDNLIWQRVRVENIFDFYYRLEIYTPAAKRQYGYYVMPILHGDRLVGRLDPKVDRKNKVLLIRALYLEEGVTVTDELVSGLRGAIERLAAFEACDTFRIEASEHAGLKEALT